MICLEEEHIKRFGLTKSAILGILIALQKQTDARENMQSHKDAEGCMWFFCTIPSLAGVIHLTEANTHRHVRELIKIGVLLKRHLASSDRRSLYRVQMERL